MKDKHNFILLLSIGRSGSTFFAQNLSKYANYHYFGEKRFLWETFRKSPLLGRYFLKKNLRKNPERKVVLDKTVYMHNYMKYVHENTNIVGIILLSRDIDAIDASAVRFEKKGMGVNRFLLRMQKYWYEYGVFMPIALLSRSHHFVNLFGVSSGKFGKGAGAGSSEEEFQKLHNAASEYAKLADVPLVLIEYENFNEDVVLLSEIGVNRHTIEMLQRDFSPN